MHRKGDKKLDGTRKTQIDPLCTPPHHIAAPYIATLQGRTNATRKIDPRLQQPPTRPRSSGQLA